MARPRKGVVPPQLRPYLFRKGGGRGRSTAPRAPRARRRSWAARAGGGIARGAKRTFGKVKDAWLEMLMAAGVGYYVPQTLSNLGFGYLLYDNVPMYKTVMDQLWGAAAAAGASDADNPWRQGGLIGIGKTFGTVDVGRTTLSAAKHGGFSRGQLVEAALDLGLIFDGPVGEWGGQQYGGSYW